MTLVQKSLQSLPDFLASFKTIYLFLALCCGVIAAWNKEMLLRVICFIGVFVFVLLKFSTFESATSELFNSIVLFLIIGYSMSAGVKMALNHWYSDW